MKRYAVFQSGFCIYGVGETIDSAISDANQWLDSPVTDDELKEVDDEYGALVIMPCSKELHDYVHENGGDVAYEISDGELHITDEQ